MMKGEWEVKCGRGNRVYDEKIYDKKLSRDCAVLFTIRILSNNLTSQDKKHFYNVYKFIQTHPNVFGNRIRYHVRNTLEKKLERKAIKKFMPMQKGDVFSTLSDTSLLKRITGYNPKTKYQDGIQKFLNWYLNYYN